MFRIVIGLLSTTVAIIAMQSSYSPLDDTTPIARRDFVESGITGVETASNDESTTVNEMDDDDDDDETSRRKLVGRKKNIEDDMEEDIEKQRNVSTMPSEGSTDDYRTLDQGRTRTLLLCCENGYRLGLNSCIETNGTSFRFPALYHAVDLTLIDAAPNPRRYFHLFVRDPCVDHQRYKLTPDENPSDAFMLLDNGSIYMENEGSILRENYCLGIVDTELFDVVLCFDSEDKKDVKLTVVFPVGLIVSVPFLFATFLVYTLIPEFKNMHGRTLRGYIGSLIVAYVILAVVQISPQQQISDPLCIVFGT